MNNKKGMELSINTLVVVILGVIILGGGILFIQNLMGVAQDTLSMVDEDSQSEITNLLSTGDIIVVLQNSRTGSYGAHSFAAGFINRLGSEYNFTVNITSPTHVIRTNGELVEVDELPSPLFDETIHLLDNGEMVNNLPVLINIPSGNPQGTYEYYFEVLYEESPGIWELYSGAHLVRITIR